MKTCEHGEDPRECGPCNLKAEMDGALDYAAKVSTFHHDIPIDSRGHYCNGAWALVTGKCPSCGYEG